MNLRYLIFMSCLYLHNFKEVHSAATCVEPTTPEGVVGPFIKLPNQFYFNLEATFMDTHETISFLEYYDHPGRRGVIQEKEKGGMDTFYFSYATNEILSVTGSTCSVADLRISSDAAIMGMTKNDTSVIFSAARMLFLEDHGTYMGTQTIRGIPCYHWKSCQKWVTFDADMSVNWYFAVDNFWSTAQSSDYHIPVRCDVEGIAHFTKFHHIYDFFHFRSGLPDDTTVFETPDGIYCPGRKITKLLPTVPRTMSFYTEIVTKNFPVIATMKEEYDSLAYMTKFTYTDLPLYQKTSTNEIVEIHDFMTGVSYVTDTVTGVCKVRPIPQSNLDSTELNPHEVRMASAQHFFDFPKDKYSYEGTKIARNGQTETWVGIKEHWPNKKSLPSTWEWHYSFGKSIDNRVEHSNIAPVQFQVHLPNERYTFNIFAYSDFQPKLSSYDVSACYLHSDRESFALSFTSFIKLYVQQNTEMFKFYIISSITTTLVIRPIRIQNMKVIVGEEEILVTFEITDVAPKIGDVKNPIKETSLPAAVNEFKDLLKKRKFVVNIYSTTSLEKTEVVPTELTYDEVQYKLTPRTTYTKGAMAGLGFGMTALGFLITLGVAMKVL